MADDRVDVREIRLDYADLVRALSQLSEQIAREIGAVQQIQAQGNVQLNAQLLGIYERSVQRRWEAGEIIRKLTLGLAGRRQANNAARDAQAEVRELLAIVEEQQCRQRMAALELRLPLLQLLARARQQGELLGTALVHGALTEELVRVLQLPALRERTE